MHARTPPRRIQDATRGDGFVEDHAQVLAIVTALRGAPTPAAAREEMRRAAAMLEPHMAEEEAADGVFAWLAALDPGLQAELARLVAEHDEIREAVLDAMGAAEARIVGAVHALADRLEAHEAAERVALDRAVGRG